MNFLLDVWCKILLRDHLRHCRRFICFFAAGPHVLLGTNCCFFFSPQCEPCIILSEPPCRVAKLINFIDQHEVEEAGGSPPVRQIAKIRTNAMHGFNQELQLRGGEASMNYHTLLLSKMQMQEKVAFLNSLVLRGCASRGEHLRWGKQGAHMRVRASIQPGHAILEINHSVIQMPVACARVEVKWTCKRLPQIHGRIVENVLPNGACTHGALPRKLLLWPCVASRLAGAQTGS